MIKEQIQVHTENLLPIIKKWLYTERDIFLRELVSNACDAIQKYKTIEGISDEEEQDQFRIDITIDSKEGTLTITDNGIGMTREEVQKYIAQVAFSSAEEFINQYSAKKEEEQIIGHFGLGFYSAFMVSKEVTIDTQSYQEGNDAVLWQCDGSNEYTLDQGKRSSRGTQITLSLSEEEKEFLDKQRISEILKKYCSFLRYPIYLDGERINPVSPLWLKPPNECEEKEYGDFYRALYPMDPNPLFWVHLNVDYPFHLKGILYFPKMSRFFDREKEQVRLYCNRVFISDQCKDVLPEYLTMLKGAFDSTDIPLNVSRSCLQVDKTVRQLATHISKKVADRLLAFYQSDRDKFIEVWPDIEPVVKLGVIQDEKFFDRVRQCLVWKNTDGVWTTIDDYLERNKEKQDKKIFYSSEEQSASQCLDLYRQQGVEVLFLGTVLDNAVINHLEGKLTGTSFQRIDGAIDDAILDSTKEKTLLDAEGKTVATHIAQFFRSQLKKEQVEVEAKSLANSELPAMIILDEKTRRFRDYMQAMQNDVPGDMMGKQTLVLNTNSPLIESVYKLGSRNQKLASEIVQEVYELALLSQQEMKGSALQEFVSRTQRVLEALTKEASLAPAQVELN